MPAEGDTSGSGPLRASRADWLALALICLVAGVLRLLELDRQSLWMDEVLTVMSSRTSPASILLDPPVDPNIPPLYYLLMWALRSMGDGEAALRLPSVVAGALSVPLMYVVAASWLGRSIGLLSALLLAVSPIHVWYSQEARPYALLIFLALISVYSLQRVQATPHALAPRISLALACALTFYVHTVAIAFLGGLVVYVLVTTARRDLAPWIATFAGAALLALPGLLLLVRVPPTVSGNSAYEFNPSHVVYTLWTFATGFSLGPTLVELRTEGLAGARRYLGIIASVLGLFSLLIGVGLAGLGRRQRSVMAGLILWVLCPIALAVLGTAVTSHPYNVRYTLLALPPVLILVAAGIWFLPRAWLRGWTGGVVIALSAASLGNYYSNPRYFRDDNRGAAAFLRAHAEPNALVIVSAPYTALPLRHYLGALPLGLVGYPSDDQGPLHDGSLQPDQVESDRVDEDLTRLVEGRPGFWLFLSRVFHSDPDGRLLGSADAHYRRAVEYTGPGVRVIRYLRSAAPDSSPR